MRDQRSLLDEIVIYSGCVDPTQPNGTVVYCDQSTNEKLTLHYRSESYEITSVLESFWFSHRFIGNMLIILSPPARHDGSFMLKSCMDVVRFDDNEIRHKIMYGCCTI